MKTFPFEFEGKPFELSRLTQGVKDKYCMPIRAEFIRRLKEMVRAGLIEPSDYVDQARSAVGIEFGSEPVAREMATEDGAKRLLKLLLVDGEAAPDDFIDRLFEEQKDETSSVSLAFTHLTEDARPKAKTPPPTLT